MSDIIDDKAAPIQADSSKTDNQEFSIKLDNSTREAMNAVYESTRKLLSLIPAGQKTTVRDLIDKVVYETKLQVSTVSGLVPLMLKAWENEGLGTVNRGRGGGVFPGGKKIRQDTRNRCESCHQVLRPTPLKGFEKLDQAKLDNKKEDQQ